MDRWARGERNMEEVELDSKYDVPAAPVPTAPVDYPATADPAAVPMRAIMPAHYRSRD